MTTLQGSNRVHYLSSASLLRHGDPSACLRAAASSVQSAYLAMQTLNVCGLFFDDRGTRKEVSETCKMERGSYITSIPQLVLIINQLVHVLLSFCVVSMGGGGGENETKWRQYRM